MFPLFSRSRKPGWLTILSRGGKMTLAHGVRRAGSRPEIAFLESFAVEGNAREALLRLKSVRGLSSYRCTTLLDEGRYNVTQLDAPTVPKEERKEALRWSLRDVVSYPVDSACVDVIDIPTDGLPGRAAAVLVVSAGEQSVRESAAPFEKAGVPLDAIDVPELAQRNVAALFEDENRGLVFLRLDENGAMLTLTFRGELVAIRRSDMNTRQLGVADPLERERVRERLLLDLQRSLDNFDRQYSYVPVSRVVLASDPVIEGLAAELAENVYVPVQEMDLAKVLDFSGVPELSDPAFQARNLLAIGAALRDEEVAA
jgi:MSHA biogenesis protein MshI